MVMGTALVQTGSRRLSCMHLRKFELFFCESVVIMVHVVPQVCLLIDSFCVEFINQVRTGNGAVFCTCVVDYNLHLTGR